MADASSGRPVRVVGKRWLPPRFTEEELTADDGSGDAGDGPWTGVDGLSHEDLEGFLSEIRPSDAKVEEAVSPLPLSDELRGGFMRELDGMRPSIRLAHDTIVDALTPAIRRRIVASHTLCLVVTVPVGAWTSPLASALNYAIRTVAIRENVMVPLTKADTLRVEHDRYSRTPSLSNVGVERLVERLGYGHTIVALVRGEIADDIGMVRALADLEIEFDPARDVPGIEAVVSQSQPGFRWPKHVHPGSLRPKPLDLAVKRAISPQHVANMLEAMLPATEAQEAAETKAVDKAEAASKVAQDSNKLFGKGSTPGRFEVIKPTEPKLSAMHGYGAAGEFGMRLARDLRAYADGKLEWADVDKGVVFHGPTGTGKTILAKAIAAEAGVAFLPMSYSDLTAHGRGYQSDVINGLGVAFEAARKAAPCILFIDEIDSLTARGSSRDYDSYHTAIMNGALTLMDGTFRREGIVVIAATNRPEELDSALTRSGRLERLIHVGLPDEDGLRGIFGYHLPGVPADVIEPAAVALAGQASGADVERYAREARRLAREAGRGIVADDLLAAAMPADTRSDEMRRLVALHESGHAIAYMSQGRMPRSVSIVGQAGLAGAVYLSRTLGMTRLVDVENEVVSLLAGRAAEDVVLGVVSGGCGGAEGDLGEAAKLVGLAVGELGLAGKLVVHRPDNALVEAELQRLYAVAVRLVRERQADVEAMADLLLEKRVLSGRVLRAFATERGIGGAR